MERCVWHNSPGSEWGCCPVYALYLLDNVLFRLCTDINPHLCLYPILPDSLYIHDVSSILDL